MQRGLGEPASIKQMIDQVVEDHKIDSDQIFITGLSAGGAMAGVMLATYPEMFAGGGLIAAMPFGVARTSYSALQRMCVGGGELGPELAELVRGASPHKGPWPCISIWHGTSDKTVDISNAEASLAQWLGVHEISNSSVVTDLVDGFPHRVWHNAEGTAVIEEYSVTNMGHGTPLNLADTDACGQSGPYSLKVGISSTQHLGTFWGLDRR